MRVIVLIALRISSIICCAIALFAAGKLAMGIRGVILVLQEFPDASASELGRLDGEFVFAPFTLAVLFTAAAFVIWRISRRFAERMR
jgi:hypothetical protein